MSSPLDTPIHGYSKQGDLVILHGLVGDVDLATIRTAMHKGTFKPFPDCKVKDDLTAVAKLLHEHLKLTPEYRDRVRTGETPIAWFICAAHRIVPPRSESYAKFPEGSQNAPLEHYSAMPPWYKDVDLNEPEKMGECNLPDLEPTDTLPLSHWDGVFYAVAAEIKFIYSSLQQRYGMKFEQGDTVLHNHGHDGNYGRRLFTVYDFAQQLERCWDRIMNPLLYAAIDFAIMQHGAFLASGDVPSLDVMLKTSGLQRLDMTVPEHIFQSLALKQAPTLKVAVRTGVREIPGLVDACASMENRRREVAAQRKTAQDALNASETESSASRAVTPTPPKLSAASPSDKGLFQKQIDETRRSEKATKSLPVYDDSRPLPATPLDNEEAIEEVDDDLLTLKRKQRHARSLGGTGVPERAAIHRSNTESAGQVPFGAFNPLEPVVRSVHEQRYVPAGGNTPLSERTVIGNYDFPRELTREELGTFSANRDEIYAALDARKQIDDFARKGDEAGKSAEKRGSRLKRFFSSSNKSSNNE